MKKTTRSIAVAITAATLISPMALAQTEGQQPQAETPAAQSENAPGMMGGMMQGRNDGQMMPMMAQMQDMMETCTEMMKKKMEGGNEQDI